MTSQRMQQQAAPSGAANANIYPAARQHRQAKPLSDYEVTMLQTSPFIGAVMWSQQQEVGELSLFGIIGDEITAAGVALALSSMGTPQNLTVRISSIGGSVTEGWAIYNQIARHPAKTKTVVIEGIAASMASVIAMVGSEIIMPQNSYMMIHNPAGSLHGTAEEMRRLANLLDHMRGVAVKTYAARTGQTTAFIEDLMNAETYLTAEEAVLLGFADRVSAPIAASAALDVSLMPSMPRHVRMMLAKIRQSPAATADIDVRMVYAKLNGRATVQKRHSRGAA